MRVMKLMAPMIRGLDVKEWQQFLVERSLLNDSADGVFGRNTASATRALQTQLTMGPDGVVGPSTMARALLNGFAPVTEPLRPGMDASVRCQSFASQIAAAGMRFVVRYYTTAANSAKLLKLDEAKALCQAGLQLVVVFQDFNNDATRFTAAIGTQQAKRALTLAAAIGQPAGSAIYFACDFDPTAAEIQGPVMEYFHAVHDVMQASPFVTGVYGSGATCRKVREAGFATLTWLAQSTGFAEYRSFMPQANLVQAAVRDLIPNQLNIDDDIAQTAEFGAFQI